jgi:hypothetical protein
MTTLSASKRFEKLHTILKDDPAVQNALDKVFLKTETNTSYSQTQINTQRPFYLLFLLTDLFLRTGDFTTEYRFNVDGNTVDISTITYGAGPNGKNVLLYHKKVPTVLKPIVLEIVNHHCADFKEKSCTWINFSILDKYDLASAHSKLARAKLQAHPALEEFTRLDKE